MSKWIKYLNFLILIGFTAYWAISFYSSFIPGKFSYFIKKSAFGQLLFPPTYTMYTIPGKQILSSEYHLYRKNRKIAIIDADSLLKSKLDAQYPSPYADKDIITYRTVFHLPNLYTAGRVHVYALDTLIQKEYSMQEFVLNNKRVLFNLKNQLNFFGTIQEENSDWKEADSVSLIIRRRLNKIEMDKDFNTKLDAYIDEKTVVELGKNLLQ